MTNNPDPELERRFTRQLLRDLDAGVPALDPRQVARFARRQRRFRASRALLGAATVLVATALTFGALRLLGQAGSDKSSLQGEPPLSAGSDVTGTGYLVELASGQVQLCVGSWRLVGAPNCSVVAVRLEGVNWDTVPGAAQVDGRWYAQQVTVHGTWTGTSVMIRSVTTAPADSTQPDLPTSCAANQGDGTGLGTTQEEAALAALDDEVFGHPDRYAGLWRAASSDGLGRIVVDVVGDSAGVASKLRALYPYPLCLIRVQFSEADLKAALRAIGESTPEWTAVVDYPRNRLTVSVTILTQDIRSRLAPYGDRIFVNQLLRSD